MWQFHPLTRDRVIEGARSAPDPVGLCTDILLQACLSHSDLLGVRWEDINVDTGHLTWLERDTGLEISAALTPELTS